MSFRRCLRHALLSTSTCLVVLLVALGCGSAPAPTQNQPEQSSPRDIQADTLERLSSLGSGAAFVMVVDPSDTGWPLLRERVVALGQDRGAILEREDWVDPVRGVLADLNIPLAPTPLDGLDRGRRIVIALGDPVVDGAPGLPTLRMAEERRVRLRHSIALPATDVERLTQALDHMLEPAGPVMTELVTGHPHARVRRVSGRGIAAILPEANGVRLVLVTYDTASAASPAVADFDVTPSAPEGTPALELATRADLGASIYLRPWRFRALTAAVGMQAALDALGRIYPEFRESALTSGTLMVLDCERVMGEPREIDDVALALTVDGDALRSEVVASLTEHGRTAATSGGTTIAPLGLRRQDVAGQAFLQWPLPPKDTPHERHLWDTAASCGLLASTTLVVGSPFRWGRQAAQQWAEGQRGILGAAGPLLGWDGLQAAVVPAEGEVTMAIAGLGRSAQVEDLAPRLLRQGLQVHTAKRDGDTVLLAGIGIDPREVFAVESASLSSKIVDARIDLRRRGISVPGLAPFHQARLEVEGDVLVGAAMWSTTSSVPTDLPRVTVPRWRSPIDEADPRGLACLLDAQRVIVPALEKMHVPGVRRDAAGPMAWIGAANEALTCAREVPATADAAVAMELFARQRTADTLMEIGHVRSATEVLQAGCDRHGGKRTCAALARTEELPQVSIPSVRLPKASCLDDTLQSSTNVTLLLANGRVALGGKPVPGGTTALGEALSEARDRPSYFGVTLLIDRDETLGDVVEVIHAMRAAGESEAWVGAMAVDHGYVGIGATLPPQTVSLPKESLDVKWHEVVNDFASYCSPIAIRF